jgi:diacylglycerol kinase (ATP)
VPSSRSARRAGKSSPIALSDILVIRNPAAGRGRASREWPAISRKLPGFEDVATTRPGEAVSIAEKASHKIVVAYGGDGTVHEVVNGLMRAGARATLGVIPVGSGDDFAKMLGNPLEKIFAGKTRFVDIGRITVAGEIRYFANGMDIGFGAHGARNVASVPGFLSGLGAYLAALVITLVRYPRLRVRLAIDDGAPLEVATVMTAVMNGSTFGGSFRVCPDARVDDGLLDVLRVDLLGRLEILGLVPKIMRGTHGGDSRLTLRRARRVVIESDEPLLVEADGEIVFAAASRLEVALLPGALRVLA